MFDVLATTRQIKTAWFGPRVMVQPGPLGKDRAVLQFAVLAARYFPSRRAFRLPGHRHFLLVTSALSCVVVIVAAVVKPGPWFGTLVIGDGFSLVIGWDYGALVALGAAVVSAGIAVAVIRDHPRH